jgi:hypothetical protein
MAHYEQKVAIFLPSFRIAITRIIIGGKSNFQKHANSKNPSWYSTFCSSKVIPKLIESAFECHFCTGVGTKPS